LAGQLLAILGDELVGEQGNDVVVELLLVS
jgi:hypothetical protein